MWRYIIIFGVTSSVIRPYLLGQNLHRVGTHFAQGAGLGLAMFLLDRKQTAVQSLRQRAYRQAA